MVFFSAAATITATTTLLLCFLSSQVALAHGPHSHSSRSSSSSGTAQVPLGASTLTINGIPFATRAYWMRQASLALPSACPFAAFGTVIVNHTDDASSNGGLGQLICTGANSGSTTGNPTMHGEFRRFVTRGSRINLSGTLLQWLLLVFFWGREGVFFSVRVSLDVLIAIGCIR